VEDTSVMLYKKTSHGIASADQKTLEWDIVVSKTQAPLFQMRDGVVGQCNAGCTTR
jgi:hypothetical protein